MLLLLRKITFYLLLALYLLLTPYAILYALGYLYNPLEGELVKTGLISIVSFPRGATVFIQGKKFSHKTPAILRDLLPGSYSVRVFHKGFDPWEKEIHVQPEKATRLEPILLLPRKPEIETVLFQSFQGLVPCTADAKILAWQGKTLDGLWKIDSFFKKGVPLGKKIVKGSQAEILNVDCKALSPLLLFRVQADGKKSFRSILLNREPKKTGEIWKSVPEDVEKMDWDSKDPTQLYYLRGGQLTRLDLSEDKVHASLASQVLGFGVKHHRLYLLNSDFSLIETNQQGTNPRPLLEDPSLGRKIFSPLQAQNYEINVFRGDLLERDLMLFRSDGGALLSNRLPYLLVDEGVRGLEYASRSDEEKILYWTKDQIGVVYFTRDSEGLFEEAPVKRILYQTGRDIRQVFWAYEDSHILFLDEDTIYLLEASGPETHPAKPLERVREKTSILYQEKNHLIYFLDPMNGFLLKRRVVD